MTGPVTVKPFSMLERPAREKGLHRATRFDGYDKFQVLFLKKLYNIISQS
jgi:hypothetical protein